MGKAMSSFIYPFLSRNKINLFKYSSAVPAPYSAPMKFHFDVFCNDVSSVKRKENRSAFE